MLSKYLVTVNILLVIGTLAVAKDESDSELHCKLADGKLLKNNETVWKKEVFQFKCVVDEMHAKLVPTACNLAAYGQGIIPFNTSISLGLMKLSCIQNKDGKYTIAKARTDMFCKTRAGRKMKHHEAIWAGFYRMKCIVNVKKLSWSIIVSDCDASYYGAGVIPVGKTQFINETGQTIFCAKDDKGRISMGVVKDEVTTTTAPEATTRRIVDENDVEARRRPVTHNCEAPEPETPPCTIMNETHLAGPDLKTPVVVINEDACCKECHADPKCKAWSYTKKDGKCQFKGGSFKKEKNPDAVSSIKETCIDDEIFCDAFSYSDCHTDPNKLAIKCKKLCSVCEGNCNQIKDAAFAGYQLAQYKDVTSGKQCCDLCTDNLRCEAWTYKKDVKRCILAHSKEAASHFTLNIAGAESGFRKKVKRCAFYNSIDLRGFTFKEVPGIISKDECCNLCNQFPQCVLWTYDTIDYTCHLKKGMNATHGPESVTVKHRISGVSSGVSKISCPDGWKEYPTACYQILSQHDNYEKASAACASIDSRADLPWFDNKQEYTEFRKYINSVYNPGSHFQVPFSMKFNNARHLEIVTKVRNSKLTCPFRNDILGWARANPSIKDGHGRKEDCTEWIKRWVRVFEQLNDVACSYTRGRTVCQIRRNPVSCRGKNGKICPQNIEERMKIC